MILCVDGFSEKDERNFNESYRISEIGDYYEHFIKVASKVGFVVTQHVQDLRTKYSKKRE